MASFHNWTGDEEIDTQVPQFLNEDNAATQEKLDTKFNKSLDIAEASDLNNFKDEGFYCCNSNSRAETILNCPTNYAFGLMVWGKGEIVYQEVREYNRSSKNQDYNNCWRRSYSESGQGVWSNWQKLAYTATTLAGYGITDGMRNDAQNSVRVPDFLKSNSNTSYLRLAGGDTFNKSATLQLYGGIHTTNAGQFLLKAADSAHSAILAGSPSGLLKWNDKNIVRSVNNSVADDDGNVNVANMRGANDLAAGKAGLVPAPAAGMQNKFLCSDATWKDAGGLPVGHEFFTMNPNIPAGCIPLLGGEYSRTAYADLWAWVQTQEGYLIGESVWQAKAAANGGNVPFYSKGDGTTTFRVPALKCWVRGADSISEVSRYLAAGLPNIEGQLGLWGTEKRFCTTSGAFSTNNGALEYGADHTIDDGLIADFDASLSNPIYGTSDTVQPPSIVGMWLVKAYGTVTNVGSTDVSNIAQGLANAETRISVLNTLVGAENNGGIVAALLEQNGYVKFSNGLILQWGSSNVTHRDTTVTFPIAFSVLYSVVGVPKSSSNLSGSNSNFGVKRQNNTSFIANMYDNGNGYAGFNWCAFGKA